MTATTLNKKMVVTTPKAHVRLVGFDHGVGGGDGGRSADGGAADTDQRGDIPSES